MSAIKQVNQSVIPFIHTITKPIGRFSIFLPQVAINLNKIAIPAIALFTLAQLPTTNAGPLEYSACTLGCALFCTPAATPACLLACAPLMLLPGP